MLAFQNGDADAFVKLFAKYQNPIYAFLARQCKNPETAADLTQDVFAKIIKTATSFQYQSKFSTWLYTIARNAAVDNSRKAKHRRHPSLDQSSEKGGTPLGERIPGKEPDPHRSTTSNRLRADLAKAIENLPDNQREVFLLREYHAIPFGEISTITGAKTGTVKSRMRYALETLRQELQTYEEYARTLS